MTHWRGGDNDLQFRFKYKFISGNDCSSLYNPDTIMSLAFFQKYKFKVNNKHILLNQILSLRKYFFFENVTKRTKPLALVCVHFLIVYYYYCL